MEKVVHLIFLVSFSEAYVTENVALLYGIEGESITINCTYSPKENQWRQKSWCKHITMTECQHVVSARRFWMPFLKRKNGTTAIADNIQDGILTVTINPLHKQDAGVYQCKTEFLGVVNTLQTVKLKVLSDLWENDTPEEPRAVHSISSTPSSYAEGNLYFLVAGFLGLKLLVAVVILIIARSKKGRTTGDESGGENGHQLFPITGDILRKALPDQTKGLSRFLQRPTRCPWEGRKQDRRATAPSCSCSPATGVQRHAASDTRDKMASSH